MGTNFWWLVIPYTILVALNITFVLVSAVLPYEDYFRLVLKLNLDFLGNEDQWTLYLQYLLFFSLVFFFVIGGMRGYATGKVRSAIFLSICVCLIVGAVSFVALPMALSLVIGGEIGLSFLTVFAISPMLIGLLLALAAAGRGLGGLIGNRFLRRRPTTT